MLTDLPAHLAPVLRSLWALGLPADPARPPAQAARAPAVDPSTRLPGLGAQRAADLLRRGDLFTRGHSIGVRQQSDTTCGPNALAMFRVLTDEGVLARALACRDAGAWGGLEHRLQRTMNRGRGTLPWPVRWGTLPWSLAHHLALLTEGRRWVVLRARPLSAAHVEGVLAVAGRWCRAGLPVPLYVGNDRLPRHVVLLLALDDDTVTVYDPALGAVRSLATGQVARGTAPVAGWRRVWCVLVPEPPAPPVRWCRVRRAVPPPGRRGP